VDATISRISSSIDTVNKGRIDAHAKDLSTEQYEELRAALDLLESAFLTPE
jgi:hypothetical protein